MADASKTPIDELQQFEPDVFWEQYGSKIIVAALVVVAVAVGIYLWQRQAADQAETAASRLAEAQDKTALERIAQDYAGKEPGAQALIRLADLDFQASLFAEAGANYQKFLNQFPNHALAESALLGLAAVAEAQGNFPDAQRQYIQLAGTHPRGFAVMAAWLGEARCLEAQGQKKQARQKYQEVMAAAQGTSWAQVAYMRWVVLGRELPDEPAAPAAAIEPGPATPANVAAPSLTTIPKP